MGAEHSVCLVLHFKVIQFDIAQLGFAPRVDFLHVVLFEYGSDFISITDEDGKEYELEVLAELEYEGSKYLALVPADDDGEEDLEVSILKAVDENGEEILVTIDDDDELEAVYSALMDLMYEDEEEEPSET